MEEKSALGEADNVAEFLSLQFGWDEQTLQSKKIAYPFLFKASVVKIQNHLNFLLNEANYTIEDINATLSIFQTKYDELKVRFFEMTEMNHRPKLYELKLSRTLYLRKIKIICHWDPTERNVEILRNCEKRLKGKK